MHIMKVRITCSHVNNDNMHYLYSHVMTICITCKVGHCQLLSPAASHLGRRQRPVPSGTFLVAVASAPYQEISIYI